MEGTEEKLIDFSAGRLVTADEKEPQECNVKGCIPDWLNGDVLRNGPGEFELGPDKFEHLFDGPAFIHKFSIKNGKVIYSGKFVQSEMFKTNRKHNRILCGGFGTKSYTDPCKNVFSRFFTTLTTTPTIDNCNVNIASLGNVHYAITDGSMAYRFDPETIDTKNLVNMMDIINIPLSTAHPHYDTNGDYYNLAITFGRNSYYNVVKVPASSLCNEDPLQDIKIHSSIKVDNPLQPTYFHSFALTENCIAFHDQPYRIQIPKFLWKVATWQPAIDSFRVDPSRKSLETKPSLKLRSTCLYKNHSTTDLLKIPYRIEPVSQALIFKASGKVEPKIRIQKFHVIDKKSGVQIPIRYATEGEFCFHFVNSFETSVEERKFLVIDLCCPGVPDMNHGLFLLKNMRKLQTPDKGSTKFKRYFLPLGVDETTPKDVNLVNIEGSMAEAKVQDDGSVLLTPEVLLNDSCSGKWELPRINYKYNGKEYRYFYAASFFEEDGCGQLVKADIQTKTGIKWNETGRIPSEPVFVERPGATAEDDGIVLSTVINQDTDKPVFLLILDAKTFTEIARAEVDTKLPLSFHAIFDVKH